MDYSVQLGKKLTDHKFKMISLIGGIIIIALLGVALGTFILFGLPELDTLADEGMNPIVFVLPAGILALMIPLSIVRLLRKMQTHYEFFENGMRVTRMGQSSEFLYTNFYNVSMVRTTHWYLIIPVGRSYTVSITTQLGQSYRNYLIDSSYTNIKQLTELLAQKQPQPATA